MDEDTVMPYSITDKNPDCSGWAVVDPANEVFGCHTTKASAIKQAVAISLATDEPFVGERKADGEKVIICDIDGTLLASGDRLIQKTWDYAQSLEGLRCHDSTTASCGCATVASA